MMARIDDVTEYGVQMSGGGFHVWDTAPDTEAVYPLELRIKNGNRHGGQVFRRRILVMSAVTEEMIRDSGRQHIEEVVARIPAPPLPDDAWLTVRTARQPFGDHLADVRESAAGRDLTAVWWRRTIDGAGETGSVIRAQLGPEPHGMDPMIGQLDTAELAAEAVAAHNAALARAERRKNSVTMTTGVSLPRVRSTLPEGAVIHVCGEEYSELRDWLESEIAADRERDRQRNPPLVGDDAPRIWIAALREVLLRFE